MVRIVRRSAVTALVAAAVVLAGPAPARAEPVPGAITATFTDVCGFVRADVVNADPNPADVAFIRFSRNGKHLDPLGTQLGGGAAGTLFQVAADGDQFHYEWTVVGGATESLDHAHVTPAGCAEPKLAVSLIDSCGPNFTISVANTGSAAAPVLIQAPTLRQVPYTVPAGGTVKVTVPGVAVSSAWVGRLRPDAGADPTKTAVVDAVQRAPGCGIPWPNKQLVVYARTCEQVAFTVYALDMKGTLTVRRNGVVVRTQPVDMDIYKFSVPVKGRDVVVIGDSPPLLTYTHKPPAGCTPAVAPVAASPTASPSPSALPPSPSAQASPSPLFSAIPVAAGTVEVDGTPIALITMSSAAGLLILGVGGWFLLAALRRRRPQIWAVASGTVIAHPFVRDIGVIPTTTVRWVVHPGSTAHYLREDVTR